MKEIALPEEIVAGLLKRSHLHLATAESCTGGLIGHRLTNVPGSSEYYLGGVISYANAAKVNLLGVQIQTLEQHGAVSQATVLEMARGVRRCLQAEIGLSVSGIAGPGGGTPDKPVGSVWIALSAPGMDQAWHYQWQGDRLSIKTQSAEAALRLLCDYLNGIMQE